MKKFNLHYANIKAVGDIPCIKFNKHKDMVAFIDQSCMDRKGECVWLITKDGLYDVFISESYLSIEEFLLNMPCWQTVGDYFLQEYPSFEDAHSVALDILETSELRYNQK